MTNLPKFSTAALHEIYAAKLTTPQAAVAPMADGETIASAMAIGQPPALLAAIAARVQDNDLKGLKLYYKIALGPLAESLMAPDLAGKVDLHSFFIGGPDRVILKHQIETGKKILSFVPVHFSQIPSLFEKHIQLDTFVATVSPMDATGHFSFGTNNDFTTTAARNCKRLILEVNRNMPRVFGQSQIHVTEAAAIVENHVPVVEAGAPESSAEGEVIGRLVAPMVPNGATIQLGIGRVPSGIALALAEHEDLGIHTELFSPVMADLVQRGVVTGRYKTLHPRKHVFTLAFGTTDSYTWMNDNPALESYASSYVNDIRTIAAHDNFISVNTAIEIDLYGQVNAEFIAGHEYSGSGGQYDFVKGSSLSRGGKSIIALASTARKGTVSSIVPRVAMSTDLRMDVEYVVTEHGVVNLRGKSTSERAMAMIGLAAPQFRDQLTEAAKKVTLI
jgi:itaconate CoA-transferase